MKQQVEEKKPWNLPKTRNRSPDEMLDAGICPISIGACLGPEIARLPPTTANGDWGTANRAGLLLPGQGARMAFSSRLNQEFPAFGSDADTDTRPMPSRGFLPQIMSGAESALP